MTDFDWPTDDPIFDDHPDPTVAAELQAEDQQARADLDLTEAIVLAARAMSTHWRDMHTNEALGLQRMLATHAVRAAAPIIARQVAEKIAAEIEREAATLDHFPTNDYRLGMRHGLAGDAEHDIIGAARIAREVAR